MIQLWDDDDDDVFFALDQQALLDFDIFTYNITQVKLDILYWFQANQTSLFALTLSALCRSRKYKLHSIWIDPTGGGTHTTYT